MDRSEGNIFGKERWQTLGMVGRVLFVVYTERGENKRIISARLADKPERRRYYQIDGKGWRKAAQRGNQGCKKDSESAYSLHGRRSPEALAEFTALRAARKKKDIRPVAALRLMPEVPAKYKALGKGYASIMADALNYVADNPEILSKIH